MVSAIFAHVQGAILWHATCCLCNLSSVAMDGLLLWMVRVDMD